MKTKILLIAMVVLMSSCSYFRVLPEDPYTVQSIKQHEDDGHFLILQRGEEAWQAYDLEIKNDSLIVRLDPQLGHHLNYLEPKEKGLNKFVKQQTDVINSVHIFTSDTTFNSLDTLVAIPVSSISGVKSYEYARAPSRASRIVPAVFIPVLGLVVISVIALQQADFGLGGSF